MVDFCVIDKDNKSIFMFLYLKIQIGGFYEV